MAMWWEHLLRLVYFFFYLASTFVCSLFGPKIGDPKHVVDPSSVFSFINYIFVSTGFLLCFAIVTILVLLNRSIRPEKMTVRQKLVEGLIALGATTYWALWRIFFVWLDQQSGSCRLKTAVERLALNRKGCVDAGGYWDGLDISGHCFLIALACSFFFDQFADAVSLLLSKSAGPYGYRSTPQLEAAAISMDQAKPKKGLLILKICYAIMLIIAMVVWVSYTALLLHTSIYFHTVWEKVYGICIGFVYWPIVVYAHIRASQLAVQ